eukprot:GILJ01021955.1.p1 GENE.GILJ01021955.1~~GILJ01021955.1.p1  ORF type:complete len:264 (-),score=41.11 GILJ01021955.1:151-942(-)
MMEIIPSNLLLDLAHQMIERNSRKILENDKILKVMVFSPSRLSTCEFSRDFCDTLMTNKGKVVMEFVLIERLVDVHHHPDANGIILYFDKRSCHISDFVSCLMDMTQAPVPIPMIFLANANAQGKIFPEIDLPNVFRVAGSNDKQNCVHALLYLTRQILQDDSLVITRQQLNMSTVQKHQMTVRQNKQHQNVLEKEDYVNIVNDETNAQTQELLEKKMKDDMVAREQELARAHAEAMEKLQQELACANAKLELIRSRLSIVCE